MGFGAARPTPKPSLLVGFLGAAAEAGSAREAGADLVVVDARGHELSAAEAAKLRSVAADLPLGAWTQVPTGESARQLRESGLDFLVVEPESTPAAALLDDDLGYVLVLSPGPEEILLRSLEPMTIEALYLVEVSVPLTVARQIELNRIGLLSRKPLICEVAADVTREDLQCLRSAGIAVLLVAKAGDIPRLKETVLALPPRRQRREERPVISLPRGQAPAAEEDGDDDDRHGP